MVVAGSDEFSSFEIIAALPSIEITILSEGPLRGLIEKWCPACTWAGDRTQRNPPLRSGSFCWPLSSHKLIKAIHQNQRPFLFLLPSLIFSFFFFFLFFFLFNFLFCFSILLFSLKQLPTVLSWFVFHFKFFFIQFSNLFYQRNLWSLCVYIHLLANSKPYRHLISVELLVKKGHLE